MFPNYCWLFLIRVQCSNLVITKFTFVLYLFNINNISFINLNGKSENEITTLATPIHLIYLLKSTTRVKILFLFLGRGGGYSPPKKTINLK